jgi:hydrogenase maturation protease
VRSPSWTADALPGYGGDPACAVPSFRDGYPWVAFYLTRIKSVAGSAGDAANIMNTLILGIGNTLLADEGTGVHVVRALQERHGEREGITLLDGGTLSFTLAADIEEADQLIVVDASELKAEPGTVRTFVGDDMDAFLNGGRRSVHEVGLMDLMTMARLAERLPERRALVGIQPQKVDWGEWPTDEVAAAIPVACDQVDQLMEAWRP